MSKEVLKIGNAEVIWNTELADENKKEECIKKISDFVEKSLKK